MRRRATGTRQNRLAYFLPLLLPLALTSACTTNGDPEPGGASDALPTAAPIHRPIDEYLPTPTQLLLIDAVRTNAFNECLSANGVAGELKYAKTDTVVPFARDAVLMRSYLSPLWGYWNHPERVAERGYNGSGEAGPEPLSQRLPAGITESIASSCEKVASDAIGGFGAAFAYASATVLPEGGPPSPRDETEYAAVAASWSSCMRESGYDFADPVAAVQEAFNIGIDSPEAIRMAVADIDCKRNVDFMDVAVELQARYDRSYILLHKAELENFRRAWQAMVDGS